MLGWAGRTPARLRSVGLGPGLAQLGPTWLGSTRLGLGWLGFGSARLGPARPVPALLSLAQHASAPGMLGLARPWRRQRFFFQSYASASFHVIAVRLQRNRTLVKSYVKNKIARLSSARPAPAWLRLGRLRCSSAQPGPARLGSARLGRGFARLGLGRLGSDWLGSGQLGLACLRSSRPRPGSALAQAAIFFPRLRKTRVNDPAIYIYK